MSGRRAALDAVATACGAAHSPTAVTWLLGVLVSLAVTRAQDHKLVGEVARGQRDALRRLYDLYAGRALAAARRVLRDAAEAEDVVQETFVEIWKRASEFDGARGSARAWIVTIARSRAINRLNAGKAANRAARRADDDPTSIAGAPPQPGAATEQRETRDQLRSALAALPDEQRLVLEMAYFDGLTQSAIAAAVGLPLGTVKTRMRLALEKLERLLDDAGPQEERRELR